MASSSHRASDFLFLLPAGNLQRNFLVGLGEDIAFSIDLLDLVPLGGNFVTVLRITGLVMRLKNWP